MLSIYKTNKKEIEIIYLFFISKGEIRTLDLTGMSRALSPTELPCHNLKYSFIILITAQILKQVQDSAGPNSLRS